MTDSIHPMQHATELRLVAAAIELQHMTISEASLVPIPGGERVIVVGEPEQVAKMLGASQEQAAVPPAGVIAAATLARRAPAPADERALFDSLVR